MTMQKIRFHENPRLFNHNFQTSYRTTYKIDKLNEEQRKIIFERLRETYKLSGG